MYGAQLRDVIQGIGLILGEDYSLKSCFKRNIIKIMGQHNGKINAINVAANYCIRTFIQILLKTEKTP